MALIRFQYFQSKLSVRTHKLKMRRQRWLVAHLWLGLSFGLLLSIYGLTGSVLVFNPELDEFLHPELLKVDVSSHSKYCSLKEIFNAGRTEMPQNAKLTFATYPRNEYAAVQLRFTLENGDGVIEQWLVAVNPYNAQVIGKQFVSRSSDWLPSTFIGVIFELHYALLMPWSFSTPIVGLSAMLLIISILTGLIVWWPLSSKWHQALTLKLGAGNARFNYDLHKISGFYTAVVLIPVLFSGVYMVLPNNVVPVLELFSPVTYRYWFESSAPNSAVSGISIEKAVEIALQRYPEGRPNMIYGVSEKRDAYTVCQNGVHSPNTLLDRRCVVIDQYSGKLLDIDDPSIGSAGEVFTHWQWPLHSGQAFGMAGRILVFISGLACPVLYVTGLIRWLQKRRAAKQHQARQSANRVC